jgi:hypothetical protein
MKRISSLLFLAGLAAMVVLSASKKETMSGSPVTKSRQPLVVDLLADQWTNPGDRVYVDDFKNILVPGCGSENGDVKVFLLENGQQIDIDSPAMIFGHQSWATLTSTDVIIHYNLGSEAVPPSLSLNIRVVIQGR